jgi:hypothetical protein
VQVALIPPYQYLETIGLRPIQMILPSCLKDPRYRNAYSLTRMAESFVIMDNGMFEDDRKSNEDLIEMIDRWQPDEFVMPDVHGDMLMTISVVESFLRMFEQIELKKRPRLQIVIQLNSVGYVQRFIEQALEIQDTFGGGTFTFGIPRWLAQRFGQYIRMYIVDWLDDLAPGQDVHLLGYARNGNHPSVFNEVELLADRVRSIDTDAPYVWAQRNAPLNVNTMFERPIDYYSRNDGDIDDLINDNIKMLDGWASGRP